ncbi:MAG: Gx transporter family protein [Eubacterium sp.]|nr:Gx transporter family protein [Eubacterium sp.]
MNKVDIRHMSRLSLLVSAGLIIFVLEGFITLPIAIPGIKLGLSNIVTLFTLYAFSRRDACLVLILRIVLGSLFGGQVVSLWYSLSGGALCLLAMSLCKFVLNEEYMVVTSVAGAVFHNIGQLLAALVILENTAIIYYLPALLLGGVLCGILTGLCCKLVFKRLKDVLKI